MSSRNWYLVFSKCNRNEKRIYSSLTLLQEGFIINEMNTMKMLLDKLKRFPQLDSTLKNETHQSRSIFLAFLILLRQRIS